VIEISRGLLYAGSREKLLRGNTMDLPFGTIKDSRLTVSFSTADYSVANVIAAVRERGDMFEALEVVFMGASTEIPSGPSPVFRPVSIIACFDYIGKGDARSILEKIYVHLWNAVAITFPTEAEWAVSKGEFARFITSQADLIRARIESNKTE